MPVQMSSLLKCLVFTLLLTATLAPPALAGSLDQWTYIQVDNKREAFQPNKKQPWLRCFGIAAGDLTGDGRADIVAGRCFYRNPGGDMTAAWPRTDFGIDVDGMLMVDVDGDAFGDIIACQFPDVFWLEADDATGGSWHSTVICQLPRSSHGNGQGALLAQIIPGGKPEPILSTDEGVFYLEIPANPEAGNWPTVKMTSNTMDEGVGAADLDGDGDLDLMGIGWEQPQYLHVWRNDASASN